MIEASDLDFLCEDLPKLLKSMNVGTERIREIVKSLRNFSRLNEAEFKVVDIHEGLDSALMILHNRLKPKADHPGIEVIKEYGQLPPVECCPGQLNQVFINLLTNAIDALDEGIRDWELEAGQKVEEMHLMQGKSFSSISNSQSQVPIIQIRTEIIQDNWVAIRIGDNGLGMSEDVHSKLFDPFFTTKPVGKGTGLGLSISYQIVVEKHGGKMQCYSAPGQGAEFVVQIPLRQSIHDPNPC
jgi:signal transduction histidine kinase